MSREPIRFTLPEPVPLHNTWQRAHWRKRSRINHTFADMIRVALNCYTWNLSPLEACEITVDRYTAYSRPPDVDAICVKPLLDALKPASRTCPYGLGIIEDDGPDVILSLVTRAYKCAKGEERTEVVITERSDASQLPTP